MFKGLLANVFALGFLFLKNQFMNCIMNFPQGNNQRGYQQRNYNLQNNRK